MKVRFVKSTFDDFPTQDKPEVVFVGRSNVGKSSLINMVVGRNIARVSKDPGRTRLINYFLLEDEVYLVDVPGYGFAKGPKREVNLWKKMMENYFHKRKENIKVCFLLVDAVVGPTERDIQMIRWLEFIGVPFCVVITKTDKASQRELSKTMKEVGKFVGKEAIILTSAKEGKGKKEILSRILER